jgi:predicted RNase H-like HicB family nuclease
MTTYIALLRKDRRSNYGVTFPDFPGCVAAAKTLVEARKMAAEALGLHIEGMIKDREPIPDSSALDTITEDPESHNAVAFLVEVATRPVKAIRVTVMLPEDLVAAIDRTTKNRSRFLAEAVRAKLNWSD